MGRHESDGSESPRRNGHGITWLEAVGYTAGLGFVGLFAAGVFDAMVPWP